MFCGRCGQENPDNFKFCNRCGSALALSDTDSISNAQFYNFEERIKTTLKDQFAIKREIGRGGMAVVYLATEISLERDIALKFLPEQYSYNPDYISRFHREAKLQAQLKHPNVINIFGIFNINNIHFFSMEYIHGITLKAYKVSKKLTIPKLCYLIKQVAVALSYAHNMEKKLVHRDLKPSNIMIDTEAKAIVMDFGVARATEGTNLTASGTMIGTPHYMSPEQIRGLPIDKRADLYSFGVILYEMATGDVPFSGDTSTIYYKHVFEPPASPRSINNDVPEWLEDIIIKCMAKEPAERFSDAMEILEEINKSGIDLSRISGEIKSDIKEIAAKNAEEQVAPKRPSSGMKKEADVILENEEQDIVKTEAVEAIDDSNRVKTPSTPGLISEVIDDGKSKEIEERDTEAFVPEEEKAKTLQKEKEDFEEFSPKKRNKIAYIVGFLFIAVIVIILFIIYGGSSQIHIYKLSDTFKLKFAKLEIGEKPAEPVDTTKIENGTNKDEPSKDKEKKTKKVEPKQPVNNNQTNVSDNSSSNTKTEKRFKFCRKCGAQIPRAAKYCPKCGAEQL